MSVRLNNKAYKILAAEIAKAANKDNIAGEVFQKIALQRLNKLKFQRGKPVTEQELHESIDDVFPNFESKIFKKAARVNRPASRLWLVPKIAIGLSSMTTLIWLLNLPYPMIRRPVARTAPILLLPSYLRMDYNYRQAIAKVEQADQLINNATSLDDLKLGREKVNLAQKHLDALPVWFLGYEPQMYRTFFSFGWKFTLDEFESARAQIGRMDAKIFQEINAVNKLETAKQDIRQAKQDYQQAQTTATKQKAIMAWQAGIDRLKQLPPSTLARQQADASYDSYLRDFLQESGFVAGNSRTNKIIAAAQQFHTRVANSCQNSPHPSHRWRECANLLEKAILILAKVPLEDPGYLETQTLLAAYEAELSEMRIRQQEEEMSQRAYESARDKIANLPQSIDGANRDRTVREILTIINELDKVQPQTTVYTQAQSVMHSAEKKLKQLQ